MHEIWRRIDEQLERWLILKTVATPLKDYQDSYHSQCAMK